MNTSIPITEKSKKLIQQLGEIEQKNLVLPITLTSTQIPEINATSLFNWLKETNKNDQQHTRFTRELLRASLLSDIHHTLLTPDEKRTLDATKEANWSDYFKFSMLAFAGTLFSICDGFDGVTSILSLFVAVPTWVVFVVGFSFSLLSVAVFYGFDLIQISTNLGVPLQKTPELLDIFVEQAEQIKQIRKKIKCIYDSDEKHDVNELKHLQAMLSVLVFRYHDLNDARIAYTDGQNKLHIHAMKLAVAAVAGILFFSYGFFAGQSMTLAIMALVCAPTAATFLPAFCMGIVVGLASFSVYWFVERPGLENLVGRWFGFDKDKIDFLTDADRKQCGKINQLDTKINGKNRYTSNLANFVAALNQPVEPMPTKKSASTPLVSNTLFKRSYSDSNIAATHNTPSLHYTV